MKEKDIIYIAASDTDSFNYEVATRQRSEVEKHNKENPDDTISIFDTWKEAQGYCDQLNSM